MLDLLLVEFLQGLLHLLYEDASLLILFAELGDLCRLLLGVVCLLLRGLGSVLLGLLGCLHLPLDEHLLPVQFLLLALNLLDLHGGVVNSLLLGRCTWLLDL